MTSVPPPANIHSVSAAWATKILRDAKAISETCVVTAVESEQFKTGHTSDSARLKLSYSSSEAGMDQPRSIVIKMARDDIKGKVLNMIGCLWREAVFYRKFSGMIPAVMNVPKFYFASVSSFNNDFVLVIGDAALVNNKLMEASTLTPPESGRPYSVTFKDRPPDYSAPCPLGSGGEQTVSYEVAETVVTSVAAMHARFWGNPSLPTSTWLDSTSAVQACLASQFVSSNFPTACKQVALHWPRFPWRGRLELIEEQVIEHSS
jgi:hypothetical protein